jgi:hypothetical protein
VIFMFICSVIMTIGGVSLLYYNKFIFTKRAETVKGKIIDFEKRSDSNSKTYKAVIEYYNPFNKQYNQFVSNIGRPTKKSLGREIDVLVYERKNGSMRCEEKSLFNQYIGPTILLVIALIILAITSVNIF